MFPPLFKAAAASTEVRALFGADPVRVYPFGEAEAGAALPYAVWQTISGNPDNFLSGRPDVDGYRTQVDIYGTTGASTLAAAMALRDALEGVAYVVAYNGQGRDPETKNFRVSFDLDWIVHR